MELPIKVPSREVTVLVVKDEDYICLTDIARYKNQDAMDDLIRNWLRNRNTIEFLGIWEQLNNPGFKPVEFDGFKKQAGLDSFTLTPKQWIERTGAVGIISKAGRYGGMNHEALYFGITIFFALTAAIVLAVGWVAYHLARIAICITRDARASRRPSRQLQHPELGTLSGESGLWGGEVQQDDRVIRFCIAGTELEPDIALIQRLRAAISRFPELERTALEFLCVQEPDVQQGEFTFQSMDFLWKHKPDSFALEFTLVGDDDGIWRVEFEGGHPKSMGRDD